MSLISDPKAVSRAMVVRYAKMLLQTLAGTDALSFDDFVPKASKVSNLETRRIAAAAFYHCLGECLVFFRLCSHDGGLSVLSTKDLMKLEQEEPYGRIEITVK